MLLVSIHDVTPAHAPAIGRLWSLCAARNIRPALLVVPNWHGEWLLDRYPLFVEWLQARAAEGAEIVLHGERHDEVGLSRRFADQWKAWGKTDGEGEFLTLGVTAAHERLARGLDLLRRLGLEPTGFVPPAWLAGEATYQAAAAAGLAFTEDDVSIRLLSVSRRLRSPVVRWSSRTRARAWGSVGVARARYLVQRGARYPRIALHPGDLDRPVTARSVIESLDAWLSRHSPGSYADLSAGLPA